MSLLILSISPLLMILQPAQSANLISLISLNEEGTAGTCLSPEKRDAVIQNITASIPNMISTSSNCGPGLWYRVAHLNMSDPSQQCPPAWREYSSSGIRACGRPITSGGSCPATLHATNRQYNRVCGRAIGYQIGSPDAFGYNAISQPLDSYYVYGVSITHGAPRNHIWTYAAGVSEGGYSFQRDNCPCSNPAHPDNAFPPSFVGDNYYCESGNPTSTFSHNHLYYSGDPLWDGEQCEGECCSNGKSPPWFSVELSNSTTDDIEVRICSGEGTYDEVLVQLLELYIQ